MALENHLHSAKSTLYLVCLISFYHSQGSKDFKSLAKKELFNCNIYLYYVYYIYRLYSVYIYIERERAVRSCRIRRCVSEFSESKLSLFFRSWVPTWSSRKPAKLKYRNGNPLGYVRIIWIIWIIWFIICFQNFQVFQGLSASHFLQSYLQQAARLVPCRGHVRQSTKKKTSTVTGPLQTQMCFKRKQD